MIDKLDRFKLPTLVSIAIGVISVRIFATLDVAYTFHHYVGYYLVLAIFLIWVALLVRRCPPIRTFRNLAAEHRAGMVLILAGAAFIQVHEPHVLRVLHDESTHAACALVMHLEKAAFIPAKAHYVAGAYLFSDYYATFRQYLFSVLVSLLHDITGYRVTNVYILNGLLSVVCLGATYLGAYKAAGKFAAIVSTGLLVTLPLFAQNVAGGGYDVLNLALIACLFCSAVFYVEAKDPHQSRRLLNLGTATALLLALSRYESVLFLILWAAIVATKWRNMRKVELTWFSVISPVFVLPNLISHLILFNSTLVTSGPRMSAGHKYFEIGYLKDHVAEAVFYFFKFDHLTTSSLLLSAVGLVGFLFLLITVLRRPAKAKSVEKVLFAFALWTAALYLIILSQYWSSPTDTLAARFTLPLFLCASLCGGWFMGQFRARRMVVSGSYIALFVWGIVFTSASESRAFATNTLGVSRGEQWMLARAATYEKTSTLFVARSNVHFIAYRYATIPLDNLTAEPWMTVRALKASLYKQVLIYQLQEIDPKTGKWMERTKDNLDVLALEVVDSSMVAPNYRAVLYRLLGYKNKDGSVVTPESDNPSLAIKTDFKSDVEVGTYRQTLYP